MSTPALKLALRITKFTKSVDFGPGAPAKAIQHIFDDLLPFHFLLVQPGYLELATVGLSVLLCQEWPQLVPCMQNDVVRNDRSDGIAIDVEKAS